MRSGLDGTTLSLYTGGVYDICWRIEVENGSGTLVSVDGRYTSIDLSLPDPQNPIAKLSVAFLRELMTGASDSLAPLVDGDLNKLDDGITYSPLLQLGRLVTVECHLVAEGAARPADVSAGWYEIFRGVITQVDWGDLDKRLVTISANDLGSVLQHQKSETAYTYTSGTSIETVAQQILDNNGFGSGDPLPVDLYFPVATGDVLPNNYAPGLQKTVWEQLTDLASAMGWVCYFRYRGTGGPELTFFEPARTKTVPDMSVTVYDYKNLSIDESEVRNVGYLVYVDTNGVEQLVGPEVDSASITKYGGSLQIRRPFWIKLDEASPIRSNTEAVAMLQAALSDVADPDVMAVAQSRPLVFGESGTDLYTISARAEFQDSNQDWALFSNRIQATVDRVPVSSFGVRGVPTAGAKSWRGLATETGYINTNPFFDTGFNTLDDILDGVDFQKVREELIDGSNSIIAVYRNGVDEPVNNLFERGVDTLDDVLESTERKHLTTNEKLLQQYKAFGDVNLAANPQFAYLGSGGATDPIGWRTSFGTWERIDNVAEAYRGRYFVRLTETNNATAYLSDGDGNDIKVPVKEGDRILVGAAAKRESGNRALYVGFIGYDENGTSVQFASHTLWASGVDALDTWYRETATFEVAAGVTTVRFRVGSYLVAGGVNGVAYFDDVEFRVLRKAEDIVEDSFRSFTDPDMLDGSRRIVNVYRSASQEAVANLFKRNEDTFADIAGTMQSSQTDFLRGTVTGELYVRGTGDDNPGNRILQLGSNTVYNSSGRGFTLSVLRRSDHTWLAYRRDGTGTGTLAAHQTYDVYGTDAARLDLANALAELRTNANGTLAAGDWGGDVLVILTSEDAVALMDASLNAPALTTELKRHGFTDNLRRIGYGNGNVRTPIVLIGIPGLESGAGIEIIGVPGGPHAEYNGILTEGNLSGFGGAQPGYIGGTYEANNLRWVAEYETITTPQDLLWWTGDVLGGAALAQEEGKVYICWAKNSALDTPGAIAAFWYEGGSWDLEILQDAPSANEPLFVISGGNPAIRSFTASVSQQFVVLHEEYAFGADAMRALRGLDIGGNLEGNVGSGSQKEDSQGTRPFATGYATGLVQDGGSVTFPQEFAEVPAVWFEGGLVGDGSLSTSVDTKKEVSAESLTTVGFTLRAKLVQAGSPVQRDHAFTGSVSSQGSAIARNLDNAPSQDNQYTVEYDVYLDVTGVGYLTATLTVDIQTNTDGAGWVNRATRTHSVTITDATPPQIGSATLNMDNVQVPFSLAGLDNTDDVRILARTWDVPGGLSGTFVINNARVFYTTDAGATEVPATAADAQMRWHAMGVV